LAGKQAKVLSAAQIKTAINYLERTRNAERDVAMFLLSLRRTDSAEHPRDSK